MDGIEMFRKTAAGVAEVGSNRGGLSLEERRILILIDGKRDIFAIPGLVDAQTLPSIIDRLAQLKLIEPVAMAAAAPETAATSISGRAAAQTPATAHLVTGVSADELKRRAVRWLNERLGPSAEPIALRIERCRSQEELRPQLARAQELIGAHIGRAAAEQFGQQIFGCTEAALDS